MKEPKKETKKALIVTDKQLQVIKEACELYGRIQIGQFTQFAEIVTQTGFSGWALRVQPDRKDGESDKQYKVRCDDAEEKDRLVCKTLIGAIYGIYREIYNWNVKPRTNESSIALDLWAALDGRREDGFHMGSEPLVQVKDIGGTEKKPKVDMICGKPFCPHCGSELEWNEETKK